MREVVRTNRPGRLDWLQLSRRYPSEEAVTGAEWIELARVVGGVLFLCVLVWRLL